MNETSPRFEFRAFAQTFGLVTDKIRRYASCDDIRETTERYLVASGAADHNVKIRGGRLEIKRLLQERDRLQQWKPVAQRQFPLPCHFVRESLLAALASDRAELSRAEYSVPDLLTELGARTGPLRMACVFKRRFRFNIQGCPAEIDELLVNQAAIASVAVESEDPAVLHPVLQDLGLSDYENVDYPRAIRRVMGIDPLPQEDRFG